ncbi:hypothetical protein B0J15DRAFT_498480 [Fusarium solani]|uniref:Uncharacterized protein n=1 Tax=Fusarium solani TaxID=169388 RepID=A0A9P9H0U4_FUSSL|nr:uncharacterized protein B0J15DRAFT_498480 [Fusarium solani]KAH7248417.1 hypothetical protein B0J15DRAFT_498480 [Fusarium solani]
MTAPTRSARIHTEKGPALSSAISARKDELLSGSVPTRFPTKTKKKRKADSDLRHPQQRRAYYHDHPRISYGFQASSQVPITSSDANEEDVTSSPLTPTSQSPSTLSLNGVLRQHRKRLYIHPLQWTSQHLHVLGCEFVTQSRTPSPPLEEITPSDPNEDLRPQQTVDASPNAIKAMKALKSLRSEFNNEKGRIWAIDDLMAAYGFAHRPRPSSSGHDLLPFGYGARVVASLKVDRVYSHSCAFAAYLDLDRIDLLRTDTVYTSWHRKLFEKWPDNEPVKRILEAKLRRIQPSAQQYDPFILAVLVALAQERRRPCPTRNAAETPSAVLKPDSNTRLSRHVIDLMASSMQVYVLATTSCDSTHLWAYTARFPAPFLDKFDQPSQACYADPLAISYFKIPLSPISTSTRMLDRTFVGKPESCPQL